MKLNKCNEILAVYSWWVISLIVGFRWILYCSDLMLLIIVVAGCRRSFFNCSRGRLMLLHTLITRSTPVTIICVLLLLLLPHSLLVNFKIRLCVGLYFYMSWDSLNGSFFFFLFFLLICHWLDTWNFFQMRSKMYHKHDWPGISC